MENKRSRKFLTLKEKIEVINLNKSGMSARSLSTRFNVGKTQIQNIIKNKSKYEEAFKKNDVSVENKRLAYKTGNEKVNELVWKWFCHARSQNYVISGPVLKAQALEFAKQENNLTFKASNGWLESFLKRHKIVFGKTSGERAQIDPTVVENWFDRLKSLCEGYHPKDIFNFDESGLVFKSGQVKTYKVKGDEAPGIKMPKDRVTLAFLCNMLGDKESLIFIWKHKKPRCFKNVKIENMDAVKYFFNKKAWMTSIIFETCMKSLDFKMKKENRKVLVFLDNASSHPDIRLENVKFEFFPPNTTAKLQPLDQGIIESFKRQFRKMQMDYCLDLLNSKQIPFQEALKQITVLDAIVWSIQSWQNVSTSTIQKCFARCDFEFEKEPLELEECPEGNDDDSNNSTVELQEYDAHNYDHLAHELFGCDYNFLCSVTEEYAIHEVFSKSVTESENEQILCSENMSSDEDTEGEDIPQETVKKCISFNEAKEGYNTLLNYSVQVGDDELFKHMTCVQKRLHELSQNVAAKQSVITSYFKKQS